MTPIRLKGLTWDHRRALGPMVEAGLAFGRRRPDVAIDWDVQPLSGFESRPLEEAAASHDLLIFDHPHVGHAAEAGLLHPLDPLVPEDVFIGPSLDTYRWRGALWAVPVDAACQTACYRPDLLPSGAPRTWAEAMALGRGRRLGAALGGVHAFMAFLTLAANCGEACAPDPGRPLLGRETARRVLAALRELAAACPPEALGWSSIALQEAMCARDDLLYCPLVFGFATYAEPARRPRLAYADIPDFGGHGPVGSTIGGAGLGVSSRSGHRAPAEAFAAFLATSEAQCAIIAAHHGQPAHRRAWSDPLIDARFGAFFSATRRTMESSAVRPRHPGYVAFQSAAGSLVEGHLRGLHGEAAVLAGLGIA